MSENFIDKWNANGQMYDIQDAGRGLPLGVATLDNNGRIPYEQLPESTVEFKGYWNANTNTPHLADGSGVKGDMYYVDVAGSQDLGSGTQYFNVGDRVLYDGSIWKNINSTAVKSVNSVMPNAQGNVALSIRVSSVAGATSPDIPTITGAPALSVGDTVKLFFTSAVTGADSATALSISYNGTSYTVKVPKEGTLPDFVATELTSGNFTYIDAYKYLELMFDGTYFIIIGNPLVLSGGGYKVYADGYCEQTGYTNNITTTAVAEYTLQIPLSIKMKDTNYYRNGIIRSSGSTQYFWLVAWAGGTSTDNLGFTYFVSTGSQLDFRIFWEVKGYAR